MTRYGLTQLLKSLNSTNQSNEMLSTLQITNSGGMNAVGQKEAKMFKINNSKKKLDTARKSRIQQIQHQDPLGASTTNILINHNSHSQQPPINKLAN